MVYTVDLMVLIMQMSISVYAIGCCWHILSRISYMREGRFQNEDHHIYAETWIEHGNSDDW